MDILGFQLNFKIGALEYNTNKIIENIKTYGNSADMLVFSELCISGYPPLDLMYEPDFIAKQYQCFQKIREATKDTKAAVVIGYIGEGLYKPFTNSLVVFSSGGIIFNYNKMLLPDYDIFDEYRHFDAGTTPGLFKYKGKVIQFAICEDLWFSDSNCYQSDPFANTACDIIIAINASPSLIGKSNTRIELCRKLTKQKDCALMYVNQVGGYDDIVFDGASFYMESNGVVKNYAESFEESMITNGFPRADLPPFTTVIDTNEFIYNQLVFGIKEYCTKCGFKKVVVGSSGGIDSALMLALAVAALGSENVEAITMPSVFSSEGSWKDSETLCNNLGVKLMSIPISNIRDSFADGYNSGTSTLFSGLADENTQARIRGTLLMAYSNKTGALVLSTGNKSELSVGYCTLYVDMNGGLAPISDLYKTEVFALSKWINRNTEIIPWNIINKAPSAELAPDQKDTDSLPEYEVLDSILRYLIEKDYYQLEQKKVPIELIEKIHKMILRNEFKRRQAAPTIKIHKKSYGYGRRVPLAQSYAPDYNIILGDILC